MDRNAKQGETKSKTEKKEGVKERKREREGGAKSERRREKPGESQSGCKPDNDAKQRRDAIKKKGLEEARGTETKARGTNREAEG